MEGYGRVSVVLVVGLLAALGSSPIVDYASAQGTGVTVATSEQTTVAEGASVVLTCTYSPQTSANQFGYLAWTKDGTTVVTYECAQTCGLVYSPGVTAEKYALSVDMVDSGNLTIFGVDLADEATYSCSVFTSDLVVASSDTPITVNVPPKNILVSNDWSRSYPNNSIVQIQIDQPYELRCSFATPSKPKATIIWEADGIAITMDDQIDEVSEDDSRLVTSSRTVHVTPGRGDTGKVLRCRVTHPSTGAIMTSNIALDIQACPSSVFIHQCPRSIVSGDSATIGCRSASTSPPPVLYWLFGNVRVDNSSADVRPMIAEDGSNILTFTRQFAKEDIARNFVCCIEKSSMCNQLCSLPCQPGIKYPPSNPQITSNIPLDSVEEGVILEINCTADANPIGPSNITWIRVDESGNAVGGRSSPLLFEAVNRADAGMYRCTVDNGIGSSRSTHTNIIVFHGPNITNNQDSRVHGNEGDDTTLTCSAEAYPAPTFTWVTPDNRNITASSRDEVAPPLTIKQTDYSIQVSSMLHINSIDSAINYGDYRCIVQNGYGTSEFVINLSGVSKPNAPYNVRFNQSLTTKTSLTLTWQAGHDGGASQSFIVTSCREGANGKCTIYRNVEARRFQIKDLRPYAWYSVSVTGVNAFGESDPSELVRSSTCPLSPSELGVVASYEHDTGQVTVVQMSNGTRPLPDDICFHLEVRVIANQRDETCLHVNDHFPVSSEVTSSQLWLLACGRGICSQPDSVLFPSEPEKSINPSGNEMDITMLIVIIASATVFVCIVFFVVVFIACRWNKRRGPQKLHQQMCSRKLPTLPRNHSDSPPSPSCHEMTGSQTYDGLELGSVNRYMQPYAQTTAAQAASRDGTREEMNNQKGDSEGCAPPSGTNLQRNHSSDGCGTYTTRLGYLPMSSPGGAPASPSNDGHTFTTEDETSGHGYIESNNDEKLDMTDDVATGLLIDIDSEERKRTPGGEDDIGYYSVPKGTRALDIDTVSENTPALSAF